MPLGGRGPRVSRGKDGSLILDSSDIGGVEGGGRAGGGRGSGGGYYAGG